MNFRLRPHEKLKDARSIGYIFQEGKKFHQYPLLFLTAPLPVYDTKVSQYPDSELQLRNALPATDLPRKLTRAPLKIAFTVPKRKFRKAVERNRIKRMMREAYRLQKNNIKLDMENDMEPVMGVIVIFIGHKLPEYSSIFRAMKCYIDQF